MQQTNTHNFKVGDKVKAKPYSEFDFSDEIYDMCQEDIKRIAGKVFEVIEIDQDGDLRLDTSFIGYRYYIHPEQCELVETSTKKPRPHAELIKQWADDDSLEIESKSELGESWYIVDKPQWHEQQLYRIKPKTVIKWKWAYETSMNSVAVTGMYYTEDEFCTEYKTPHNRHKLKWTAKEFEI